MDDSQWAATEASPEGIALFTMPPSNRIQENLISFCQLFLNQLSLITRTHCIAIFPILADPVDVKKGDQQCETVSQLFTHPEKCVDQWAADPGPVWTMDGND